MICDECAWEADLTEPRYYPVDHPPVGHAACQGCDCMHKPKGAWRGGAVHE